MKINANEWVLANINVTGYYRVNYDNENWERLLNALQSTTSRQVRRNTFIKKAGDIVKDTYSLIECLKFWIVYRST